MVPPDKDVSVYFQLYQSINNLLISLNNVSNLLEYNKEQQEKMYNLLNVMSELLVSLVDMHKKNYLYKKIVIYQAIIITSLIFAFILKSFNGYEIFKILRGIL